MLQYVFKMELLSDVELYGIEPTPIFNFDQSPKGPEIELEFCQQPPTSWQEIPDSIISQATITGRDYHRYLPVSGSLRIPGIRQVQIGMQLNQRTGLVRFESWRPDIHPPMADFPRLSLARLPQEVMDPGAAERTLKTARRKRASRAHPVDVDEATRARGGDPDSRIPKPQESFLLAI